ncbi:MAG: acyltransferase, partial [Alphaproteobacteria bacterium]|nr:acyltransferase [Alphaproteobacteria bacterium]
MTILTRTAEMVRSDTVIGARSYRFLGSYRFILAILVLMSHTSSFTLPVINDLRLGNVGVLLFFVVSGFVICEACDVFYRGRIANFLLNRALKIYPAFWAATIGAYVIFTHIDPRINPDIPTVDFSPWPLLVNATLLLGYLKQGNGLVIISQTWAILTEFQFYFIAAFLFFLAPRFRNPGAWLGAAAAVALACHLYIWETGSQTRFFGQLFHAPFFVFGGAWY